MEGWRAAETAHHANMYTVSSHRSTSAVDYMETEVALALSMERKGLGRCLFAKCGGAKLIERAMRYAIAQQWVEDWQEGTALTKPVAPDETVMLCKAYPAPLNTGSLTTGIRMRLSSGHEVNAVVPAGTSTGETEACLVPTADAVKNVNELVKELGLIGMRIGDLPGQIELDHQLLALELREAYRLGQIGKKDSEDKLQEAAEMKRALGGNSILAISVAFNRLRAVASGKPSWLTLREAGEEQSLRGMTLNDKAFYEPVFKIYKDQPSQMKPHTLFGASSRLDI